jgi:hypothetical protein
MKVEIIGHFLEKFELRRAQHVDTITVIADANGDVHVTINDSEDKARERWIRIDANWRIQGFGEDPRLTLAAFFERCARKIRDIP